MPTTTTDGQTVHFTPRACAQSKKETLRLTTVTVSFLHYYRHGYPCHTLWYRSFKRITLLQSKHWVLAILQHNQGVRRALQVRVQRTDMNFQDASCMSGIDREQYYFLYTWNNDFVLCACIALVNCTHGTVLMKMKKCIVHYRCNVSKPLCKFSTGIYYIQCRIF